MAAALMGAGMNSEWARLFQELTHGVNTGRVAWEGGHPLWRGETDVERCSPRSSETSDRRATETRAPRETLGHGFDLERLQDLRLARSPAPPLGKDGNRDRDGQTSSDCNLQRKQRPLLRSLNPYEETGIGGDPAEAHPRRSSRSVASISSGVALNPASARILARAACCALVGAPFRRLGAFARLRVVPWLPLTPREFIPQTYHDGSKRHLCKRLRAGLRT
jgi:hypothetical protein